MQVQTLLNVPFQWRDFTSFWFIQIRARDIYDKVSSNNVKQGKITSSFADLFPANADPFIT